MTAQTPKFDPKAAVLSPCIGVCTLRDDMCVGCFRTTSEITGWLAASPAEQQDIVERAATRQREANT